jgi:hypothetical protein
MNLPVDCGHNVVADLRRRHESFDHAIEMAADDVTTQGRDYDDRYSER